MAIPFWMPKGTGGPSIKSRALPTLPGRNHRLFRAVEDVNYRWGLGQSILLIYSCNNAKQKTKRYDNAIFLKSHGFSAWAKLIKYHRREQVENTFYRLKKSFGGSFLSREKQNRENEMAIKCNLLNRMFTLCKPICLPDL